MRAATIIRVYDNVGDTVAVALGVLVQNLIVIFGLRKLGNNVPGVNQARDLELVSREETRQQRNGAAVQSKDIRSREHREEY